MRMQHYSIFLRAFNFDIKYKKSADHGNVDCLSRLPVRETKQHEFDLIDIYLLDNIETLPVTAKELEIETQKDTMLSKIVKLLKSGGNLEELNLRNEEFSLKGNIIFRKVRIVIPKSLHNKILKELHSGHFGTVKMKNLARRYCWWKGIDKDIEAITKNCRTCNLFQKNPPTQKGHQWEAATEPFERVYIDFAGPFLGYTFLILVDAFTKWPEVHLMRHITAKETIEKCREIFTTFGLPRVLVSDNGRTFISSDFQKFLKENGIIHKRTAPYNPSTNGLAERFVQTLKQALRKLNCEGDNIKTNLQKALFQYRLMPHQETGKSPSEMMLGRNLRSRLDLMLPLTNEINKSNLNESIITRSFSEGEKVACRDYLSKNCKWCFGTVIQRLGKLHYYISLENERVWKRHVNQMRKIGDKVFKNKNQPLHDYEDPQLTENESALENEISISDDESMINEHTEKGVDDNASVADQEVVKGRVR